MASETPHAAQVAQLLTELWQLEDARLTLLTQPATTIGIGESSITYRSTDAVDARIDSVLGELFVLELAGANVDFVRPVPTGG